MLHAGLDHKASVVRQLPDFLVIQEKFGHSSRSRIQTVDKQCERGITKIQAFEGPRNPKLEPS